MKEISKNSIFQSIIVGIIVTVVSTLIVSFVKSTSFLKSLKIIYDFLVNIIVNLLTFRVPVWIILLTIISLIFCLYIYIKLQDNRGSSTFLSYVEDDIEGIKWVWSWYKNYNGNYDFKDGSPIPLCMNCKGQIVPEANEYYNDKMALICEHCGFRKQLSQSFYEYHDKIKREIDRRIRVKKESSN